MERVLVSISLGLIIIVSAIVGLLINNESEYTGSAYKPLDYQPSSELSVSTCLNELVYGEIYVKFKPSKKSLEQVFSDNKVIEGASAKRVFPMNKNADKKKQVGLDRWLKVSIPQNLDPKIAVKKYLRMKDVEAATVIYEPCPLEIVPNDPMLIPQQWHLNNTGLWPDPSGQTVPPKAGHDINIFQAWELEKGNVLIGNPDTSLFWFHEDLIDRVWKNLGEDADGDGIVVVQNGTKIIDYKDIDGNPAQRTITQWSFDPDDINGIDDDNNGYVDDFIGWDFNDDDNDPFADGSSGDYARHGTATTGMIVAGTNNSLGLSGTCWNCSVIATSGSIRRPGTLAYLIDSGVKVVSISFMEYEIDPLIMDLLNYAKANDVFVTVAAGNSGTDLINAFCDVEYVMCTTGFTFTGFKWPLSVYGFNADITAPAQVWTTSNAEHPYFPYVFSYGTSLASPVVAGVAGLVRSHNPQLSAEEVKSIILTSSNQPRTTNLFTGSGRLNAYGAVFLANRSYDYGSFPVSMIDANKSVLEGKQTLKIFGTSKSPDFSSYEVFIGELSEGLYPYTWHSVSQGFAPVIDDILATIDPSTLEIGTYAIKLVTNDTNGQHSRHNTYIVVGDSLPWEPTWPKSFEPSSGPMTTISDLDNDGSAEILVADENGLYIYNHNQTLHEIPFTLGPGIFSVGDIMGDSDKEFGISDSSAGYHIFDKNLQILKLFANTLNFFYYRGIMYNVDSDSKKELLLFGINTSSGINYQLDLYDDDFSLLNGWPITVPYGMTPGPVIGDLDNDRIIEIVIAVSNTLYIFDSSGNIELQKTLPFTLTQTSDMVVADIDYNGDADIIITSAGETYAFSSSGFLMNGWPLPYTGKLSVVDLENDGFLEVVIGGTSVIVVDYLGNTRLNIPISTANGGVDTAVTTGDITGDGIFELLINDYGDIYVYNTSGQLEPQWPQRTRSTYPVPPSASNNAPLVHDINNDSKAEIMFGLQNLYIWQANKTYSEVRGWNYIRGDEAGSGFYHSEPVCGDRLCEVGENLATCLSDCATITCSQRPQSSCLAEPSCEWCLECQDNKTNVAGADSCTLLGSCNYQCIPGSCGAECAPPEIIEERTCIDRFTVEINTSTCNNGCGYDVISVYEDCSALGQICSSGACYDEVDCSLLSPTIMCINTVGSQCEICDCPQGDYCGIAGQCSCGNIYDLNGDTVVDIWDLFFTFDYYGMRSTDLSWDSNSSLSDVNNDQRVNIFDLVVIAANFS